MGNNKEELVKCVSMPAVLVRNAFPTAGAEFCKFSQSLEFRVTEGAQFIELQLAQPYNTHWEILSGGTLPNRTLIRVQFLADTQEDVKEEADVAIVLSPEGEESEEERVGRVLTANAKIFEIRSKREFLPLLVHIVDTLNKAHLKKIPTTVNTYKPLSVKMLEDDENLPKNSIFASLLRNIPGVSEEAAKALTRHFQTVDNLIGNLHALEDFRFQASGGNARALTRPVVERIRALFDPNAQASDVIVSAD